MKEKFENSFEGYTGKQFEEEVFGRCGGPWDGETFLNYSDSIKYAKDNQPPGWRLDDPEPRFAGDLFANVAEDLGLDDWSELKLYGAVGTPLDRFHGVDAFFEYKDHIVTMDVTLNKQKEEYKADFVVDPETTDLEIVADGIATRMNRRLKVDEKSINK